MGLLQPDRYFARLSHVDVRADLLQRGLSHVLLDIDNTVLARDTHEVPRDAARWLAQARTAGVGVCLLSNNWHQSVCELACSLDLPIVAKALKPLPFGFARAMGKLGASRGDTVAIGDQLLTDVLGAHLLGLQAYLLQPLATVDLRHTLALRRLEQALMGEQAPEPAPAPLALEMEEGAAPCAASGKEGCDA